jgi:hypothetical protein
MSEDRFGINDLMPWLVAGTLISLVFFFLFVAAHEFFNLQAVSALSAFSAAVSALMSALLVGIYIKQTRIFERHGEILKNQSELMELEFVPDVSPVGRPEIDNNHVEIDLKNKGDGISTKVELLTRLEFQGDTDYTSPLTGTCTMERVGDNRMGEKSLNSGEAGRFRGKAILGVTTLGGDKSNRTFENIVRNIQSDIDDIRVSLFIKYTGPRGNSSTTSILHEEAFYTDLDGVTKTTLEECHARSSPA